MQSLGILASLEIPPSVHFEMQKLLTDFFNVSSTSVDKRASTHSFTTLTENSLPSSAGNTPKSKKLYKRKFSECDKRLQQTIIDAGQKRIGLEHCIKCGMIYNVDDKKDVDEHQKFHNRFTEKQSFRVTSSQMEIWKKNLYWEYVKTPINGYIFRLSSQSRATLKRRFEEIVKSYVDIELGYCPDLPIWDAEDKRQALVFIAEAAQKEPIFVGGLVIIDRVSKVTVLPQKKIFQGQFLGVNRIWIHFQLRRKGLASVLLDSARRLMTHGGELPRTRLAFSDPTESGKQLAISYVGDQENGRYITYSL